MPKVLDDIRRELKRKADPARRESLRRFFKEPVNPLGVPTAVVREISARYWRVAGAECKHTILWLCEQLLRSGVVEETTVGLDWAYRLRHCYTKGDFRRFQTWLKKYVDNWGACDDFCTHAFGDFVFQYPQVLPRTLAWTKSNNRWLRRAAAVVLIYSVKRTNVLREVLRVADRLLRDEDDLVQKGYGWMLKVAADQHPDEVFAYVLEHKDRMPRTALRTAVEKMPANRKKQAMERGAG